MEHRDLRDILAGTLLIVLGLFAATYSTMTLSLGTLRNVGPGLYPASLGVILTLFGLGIFVPALFRRGEPLPKMDLRSLFFILLSVVAFAALVESFGIFPAIAAMSLVATRADSRLSLTWAIVLAVVLALGSVLIFEIGLGMPLKAFDWPWS